MSLRIEQRQAAPGTIVLSLTGRVMLGEESAGIDTLITRLLGEGNRNFVIDLGGVTHIDSTGIGRFIAGFNKVFQAGGRLVMAGATGQVRDSFAVTRLDTVFRFYADSAEALGAVDSKN
jgi:anti-sigma B factor antagonist